MHENTDRTTRQITKDEEEGKGEDENENPVKNRECIAQPTNQTCLANQQPVD